MTWLGKYEAILFDLDGVLVDSLGVIERILRGWAGEHGLDGDQAVELSHGRRDIDLIRLLAPHLDAEAETARIVAREERDTAGVRALPGAAALLTALPPKAWAVVTSGTRAVAHARLSAAGLPMPALLLGAEDVPAGKPDPIGYLWAAQLLGSVAPHCLVVEDAEAGARAARAAGMDCLGVGSALEDRPDLVVAHVPELSHVRASVEGGSLAIGTR
ncbi:HAD-IA family hydrolase [Microtetraspora malaysiensis]|uniref:HAD-IA family hydrolase n=1 Tax=Microtetraspora malaysiensis TaxID=161358 RepID=UPI003D919058